MKQLRKLLSLVLVLALILPMIPPIQARENQPQERFAEPLAHQPHSANEITVQGSAKLEHPTKEEIIAKWATVTDASVLYSQKPSVTAPYAAGKLSDDFLESGITYLNYVRFVAGLPEVTLDDALNESAQYGAVLLAANDVLTHYPSQPEDMDDAFYDKGYAATSSSNISSRWGFDDLTTMLQSSVEGCMNDNNSLGNLQSVGHRRWLLNPYLGKVGFGYALSDSDTSYITTKVFDESGAGCSFDFISWPASGNHPTNLFNFQNPWSVTLNTSVYKRAALDTLKITLTRVSDGKQWLFDSTTGDPNYDYYIGTTPYLTVENSWYGIPNCIIFHPGTDSVTRYEGLYRVEISGLFYTDGTAAEIEYEVDFFDVEPVNCDHIYKYYVTEPTCEEQGYTSYTCIECGYRIVSDYTDPVDHSYVDGKCKWCGTPDTVVSGTCGDNLTWKLVDGVLTISGTGDMYDYTEGTAPWYGQEVTRVVLEEGITSIGDYAFVGTAMTELTIPGTVSAIGSEVFAYSDDLEHVYFEGDAPAIAADAFTSLWFTAYYPYRNDTWTEDKRIPYSGHLTWEPYCPDGGYPCDEGAHVPGLKTSGSESGFCKWCGIPCRSSNDTIWAIEEDGTMYVYGTGEMYAHDMNWNKYADQVTALVVKEGITGTLHGFSQFENLVSVSLPEGITCIEKECFAACTSLKQINLPDTLIQIGSNAFNGCTSLTEIYLPAQLLYFGSAVFAGCANLETIHVDENNPYYFTDAQGVLYSMDGTHLYAAPGKLSGHYTVPGSTRMILGGSFWGCTKLTDVIISEGVQMLSGYEFRNCTSLKTVTIPDGLMDMGFYTFENCTALETILFEGDAPMGFDIFPGVTATAYYPAGNETWTEDVMQTYGGNITWVPRGETEDYQVTWKYTSASLNGTIDLNFYALLSENLVDAKDAYVRFTFAGKVLDIPLSEAGIYTVSGEKLHRFTVELYAKYVSEDVTVQFMKGDQPIGNTFRSSVMNYCMSRIEKSTNPKQVAICKALLNYAAAAQLSFDHNTGNLANAGLSDADKVLPKNVDVSAYKAALTGSEPGISVLGASLVLEGKVIVRVYFALEQGRNINNYSFTINGKAAQIQKNSTGYYLETEGIPAKELENMFTFKVGGLSYTYGPMSYVLNKLTSTKPLTVNMVKALYAYYTAAENYFS